MFKVLHNISFLNSLILLFLLSFTTYVKYVSSIKSPAGAIRQQLSFSVMCNEVWSDERRLEMAKFFTILYVIIIVSSSGLGQLISIFLIFDIF